MSCTSFDIEASDGRAYRIFLFVPEAPPPDTGWPLLCLTDGNAVFATARDAMLIQADDPPGTNVGLGVIAAIGYPIEGLFDPFRRSWDLSPPPGKVYPPFVEGGSAVLTGGASEFLDFIEQGLKPRIARRAFIDSSRQTLFGHSFGGLFTLYALFSRPLAFQTYVAASPTLYWENETIASVREPFLAACAGRPSVRVLLSAGQYEGEDLPSFQQSRADAAELLAQSRVMKTGRSAADLARMLSERSCGRVHATYEEFAGENHMSVLPVAINRAVQAAFAIT